jgi:hypothetical protein
MAKPIISTLYFSNAGIATDKKYYVDGAISSEFGRIW